MPQAAFTTFLHERTKKPFSGGSSSGHVLAATKNVEITRTVLIALNVHLMLDVQGEDSSAKHYRQFILQLIYSRVISYMNLISNC